MPPGPRGHPVVGSLHEWIQARNSGTMVLWLVQQAEHSGEMTTLSMGTKTWVLLNSSRVVGEILGKRASLTHERPYFPIAGGLVSYGNNRLFLLETEQWRPGRRLLHQLIMGPLSKSHGRVVEGASVGLLKAMLDEPQAWYQHTYRYPAAIMHQLMASSPMRKSRAELTELQNVTSTFLTSINSSFVEFFPQLSYIPPMLQPWRPHWENMGRYHYNVFKHWWKNWEPLGNPAAEPSFLRDTIFREFEARGTAEEKRAMYFAILTIVAGADNPRMTMNAWFMACLAYPKVMQKARKEIDRLCGSAERLPTLADLPSLPYCTAVVKEVLRWRPIVPLVPQRVAVEDIEFEGYRFPRGTEFLVNTVPVCTYGFERPEEFLPERWLSPCRETKNLGGESMTAVEQEPWQFAFNTGRRSCVGYKLAQKELFIAFARLLYCFDIEPRGEFDDTRLNAFSAGEPFPVKMLVRSLAHEYLIRNEAVEVDVWGDQD